ncbi:MAG TPA: hypothetical protein VNJ01_13710 [Bacteriovoracaceae bacterium]|nr:hypothetical protein [Bacteriovoracaceae bacterium]
MEAIYRDHLLRVPILERHADMFANELRRAQNVHSVTARVKDPEHLIVKIIRKKIDDPKRDYSLESYTEKVEDLIGLRAFHLFKSDWSIIHQHILDEFDLKEDEPVIAWTREGDAKEIKDLYESFKIQVKDHPRNYRSVHYILEHPLTKGRKIRAELQVRTIFEEGWGEVDHRVRYPHNMADPLIKAMSDVLNRSAGSSDEMSSFMQQLHGFLANQKAALEERDQQIQQQVSQLDEVQEQLKQTIKQSKATKSEKEALEALVADLRKKVATPARFAIGFDPETSIMDAYQPTYTVPEPDYSIPAQIGSYSYTPPPFSLSSQPLRYDSATELIKNQNSFISPPIVAPNLTTGQIAPIQNLVVAQRVIMSQTELNAMLPL